jgi:hypothetical protein
MVDTRDAIQAIGESLTAFMKSGPQSNNHREEIKSQMSEAMRAISTTVEQATGSYIRVGEDFLEKVIQVRGMPTREIFGNGDSRSGIVSSSGSQIAQHFDVLLPTIQACLSECVVTYRLQAGCYFDQQLAKLHSLLDEFLRQVPSGGTKDKVVKSQITEIKKELRQFVKWEKLFYVYKAHSLASEIEFIFALQGNPLAAIWHHSQLDEQGEYDKTYDHKMQDGNVYAVRGNWALEKGLMKVGPHGYINDSTRPAQEIGCMCHLQWIYLLTSLPSEMLTEKGRLAVARGSANIAAASLDLSKLKLTSVTEPENSQSRPRGWLTRWFSKC